MAVNQKIAGAYIDLVARTESLKKGLDEANVELKRFSQATRKASEEAKGSIALLGESIGVVLPRHLREFVSKLPGVTTAMSAAFDAVAVLALVDVIVKAGEKLNDFIQKNEEAAKKNVAAWTSIHTSITEQNDDLELTKTKLQNAIAQLEHKPENKLAEAIAEANVEADKLGAKIDEVVKQISEAVKGEESGTLSRFLLHQTGGTQTQKVIDTLQLQLSNIDNGYVQGDPTQLRQQALQTALTALQPIIQSSHAIVSQLQANGVDLQNSAAAKEYQSSSQSAQAISGMLSFAGNTQQVNSLQQKQSQLQGAKDAASALEQIDKKQLETLTQALSQKEELLGKDAVFEAGYWQNVISTLHQGTSAYNEALEKIHTATMQNNEALSKEMEAMNKAQATAPPDMRIGGSEMSAERLAAEQAKGLEIQAQVTAAYQAEIDKIGVATGAVSKHQAAIDEANAHTAEYTSQLKALQSALDQLKDTYGLDQMFGMGNQNLAQQQNLINQITELQGRQRVQGVGDQASVAMTTGTQEVIDALNNLTNEFNDTAKMFSDVFVHGLNEVNNQLLNGLTGKRVDLNKVGEDVFTNIARGGLQKAEGSILGALGFGNGKKAQHVIVDNFPKIPGMSGAPSTVMGSTGLLGLMNNSNFFGSLFGGRLFGSGGIFAGHALGGDVDAGVPITTGELGPEVFTPSVPGTITPHSEIGGGNTVHIDARGATDPAATAAAVQRAMANYMPYAIHASVARMHDNTRRTPRTSP